MKKRSALMVAAGLVFTLVVGGLAVAIGITGPTVSGGTPRAARSVQPEVRTVKRTVTVHKKAKAGGSSVVRVADPSTAATSSSPTGSDDTLSDDSSSDDSSSEDYDSGEHESEDHESGESEDSEDGSHDEAGSEDD